MRVDELREEELPVLELSFVYGDVAIRAGDERDRIFVPQGDTLAAIERDFAHEAKLRSLLESFGAVEIGCLEDVEPSLDSSADYLVHADGGANAYCSFSAYALPQLRSLGWDVRVAPSYRYGVVEGEVPFFVNLSPDDDVPDWFNLELGIEHQGTRISLLPALLELLERTSGDGGLAGLVRMATRAIALPVGDGVYLPLPSERLTRILLVVRDLYEGCRDGLKLSRTLEPSLSVSAAAAGALSHLDEVLTDTGAGVAWAGGDRLRELGSALVAGPSTTPSVARGLTVELRPYQVEGVAWLQHLRSLGLGGVLADDMGLGKTLQTIAHVLAEKEQGRLARPVLIVAPTSLVPGWCRELERFAPGLSVLPLVGPKRHARFREIGSTDVVVTSYPLITRDLATYESHGFYIVVLDEAQTIKNQNSRASQAVRSVPSELRLCLTGTPIENNLGELFSLFDFLIPGLLGSRAQFQGSFRLPIEMGDESRLEQLRRRVAPFILRRLKRDVATELPPKTDIVRPIELSEGERELYESIRIAAHAKVRASIRKKGLAASTVPVLDALMKLRQVACHPRLVRVPAASQVTTATKYETTLDLLRRFAREGRKVLVFSQFARMLALLSEGLLRDGIRHVTLTGKTTDRQARVDAFQSGRADVFLISLKAGGTGLTLTAADTVIHFDPWWNPAAQSQATDRAYRIGQTKPVFVYRMIASGSVEERMLQLQQKKQRLADAVLHGGAAEGALSEEEIDDLFAPLE